MTKEEQEKKTEYVNTEIESFKMWYLKKQDFIKELFNYDLLRYSFEYIPTLLIAITKNKNLQQDLITDESALAFFITVSNEFKSIINDLEQIYIKGFNKNMKKLNEKADVIIRLLTIKDIINYFHTKQIKLDDNFMSLADSYIKTNKKLLEGGSLSEKELEELDEHCNNFLKKTEEEYISTNNLCEIFSRELNIPMHNIEI